jgi:hypothetical protein
MAIIWHNFRKRRVLGVGTLIAAGMIITPIALPSTGSGTVPSATPHSVPQNFISGSGSELNTLNKQPSQTVVESSIKAESDNPKLQSVKSHSSSSNNSAETTVRINGQNVPIPKHGSIHKTIQGNGSQTEITVDVDSDSSNSVTQDTKIRVESGSDSHFSHQTRSDE